MKERRAGESERVTDVIGGRERERERERERLDDRDVLCL